MDIKVDSDKGRMICHGCLSGNRKICYVSQEMSDLFNILRNDFTDRYIQLELCWECIALLAKVKMFQARIQTAQCLLMDYTQNHYKLGGIPNPVNLSSLSETHLKTYNYEFSEELKYDAVGPDHLNIFNDKDKRKEIVDRDETKEITTKDIFVDIKIEDSNIKEEEECEENNDCNDSDYFETEPKVKKEQYVKKSNKIKHRKTDKKYRGYAIVTRRYEVSYKTYMKFAESVVLDKLEYENVLKRDNKHNYCRMPFKCEECKEGYFQELDLQRHQSFCHSEKVTFPYKCAACPTIVTSLDHMDKHWSEVHSKLYKCTICGEIYHNTTRFKRHIKLKHHKTYTCKECPHDYSSLGDFRTHYRATHERVTCDHCNKVFVEKAKLVKHVRRVHLPVNCSICNQMFTNQRVLYYHKMTTHPNPTMSAEELSYCVECDRQFPSVFKYKQHLSDSVKHTPKKKESVPCPDCGKVFRSKYFMNNHYKFAHLKVTKHYCKQCDKYYTTGAALRRHIVRLHKKIPFPKDKVCDICGRGFASNTILNNHRRTHTGERPFQCKYCLAAFAQKSAMMSHQKSQHKNLDLSC